MAVPGVGPIIASTSRPGRCNVSTGRARGAFWRRTWRRARSSDGEASARRDARIKLSAASASLKNEPIITR